MRSVFTSPRLENVEAVAKMLRDADIEIKVSQDRSYKGKRRRQFSYRKGGDASEFPQVWVLKAEDQPKARQILREAGLIDSTRPEFFSQSQSYLPPSRSLMIDRKPDRRASIVMRIRMVLLAIITLLTILTLGGVIHR